MPNDMLCPITSFKISNKQIDDGDLKLNDSLYLHFSRKNDAYPIADIQTTEGEGVCYNY